MLTTRTPSAHDWALREFRKFRNGGLFAPLALGAQTIVFPGFDGGAEWGGSAFDPESGCYLRQRERPRVDWRARGQRAAGQRRRALPAAMRRVPSRRLRRHATADSDARRRGVAPHAEQLTAVIRAGAGRMPGFPNLSAREVNAIIQYMATGGKFARTTLRRPARRRS